MLAQLLNGGTDGSPPVALIVIAAVVFTSLAAAAIYVGFFVPRKTRGATRDPQRADGAQEGDPATSLNPAERAANEATKWI